MASSRDDFIIAIRSAFLRKSTRQKFSLLTLVFLSVFIIILSNLDFKIIRFLKIGINEIVYRSTFVVSIPENFFKNTYIKIDEFAKHFDEYQINKNELEKLKSKNISSEIIRSENQELKQLINDFVASDNKILSKILVDHNSPFLKTFVINKGSKDNIKIGTNIYDQSYLVGKVIEVNYSTSRILLLSDLNSNVPVSIVPGNIQAIVSGLGDNFGELKYIKDGIAKEILDDSIVYTSGTGGIFRSGIPVGKIEKLKENENDIKFIVNFYSDFSQLKYILAEVEDPNFQKKVKTDSSLTDIDKIESPMTMKLKLLENEKNILEKSKIKFIDENAKLKKQINDLNSQILSYKKKINSQLEIIDQSKIDIKELEFLRLNLIYSHKCSKSFLRTGYRVGTLEYKNCIMNKGIIDND